jgi:nicotinamidase-related amidase
MKKALLVIDMQNDYLWEKPRKKQFDYDTAKLVGNVNAIIEKYNNEGHTVVYIAHLVQNLWTNRKLFGYSIQGSEGAKLYGGLNVVSGNYFEKFLGDAFTSKKFAGFVKENEYDTIALCGLDECGCVAATARGALKRGLAVEILTRGIGTSGYFPEKKIANTREELKSRGVKYVQ